MTLPPDYRPFIDPIDLFVGFGWGMFLPPLLFAAALVYHTLRVEGEVVLLEVAGKAAWLALRILALFALLALVLRWI